MMSRNPIDLDEAANIAVSKMLHLAGYDFTRLDGWSEKDQRHFQALFTAGLSAEEAERIVLEASHADVVDLAMWREELGRVA